MTNMLKHARNTGNSGIHFYKQISMNNIAPDLQNAGYTKLPSKSYKNAEATKFLLQSSTLSKDTPANFYLSMMFSLSFMISSVAPTQSLTFYAYLITKIGSCNLN